MKQLAREVIRDLRKNMNLSQEQVAEIVGCHACTISRIETGKCIPYRKNYERIFLVLGGYGIDYEEINEKSGFLQEQISKKVVESMENWELEEARQRLCELREFLDLKDKYDRQLLYTLELILTKMESGKIVGLKEKFIELLQVSRTRADLERNPCSAWLTPIEMMILNNLALCYIDEDKSEWAIDIYNLLIKNCEDVNDILLVEKTRAVLYNNLSFSYLKMNQPKKALSAIDRGIHCLRKKGGINLLIQILLLKVKIYERLGELNEAESLKSCVKLGCSVLNQGEQNFLNFEEFESHCGGIYLL